MEAALQSSQPTAIRDEIAGNMALRTVLPIAALIPGLLLVTVLVVARFAATDGPPGRRSRCETRR